MLLANYHEERGTLSQIAVSPESPATMFVSGPSEFGKTRLLRWFEETYGANARIYYIDLSEPGLPVTPTFVMSSCAGELGWEHFEQYQAGIVEMQAARAVIQNVTVNGNNNDFTAATGVTEEDQLDRSIPLTDAFVAGLAGVAAKGRPVIICLDGYKSPETLTEQWVRRVLLRRIVRKSCARLVIASRAPPAESLRAGAGDMLAIELSGVHDVHEWIRIAQELKCALPGDDPEDVEDRLRDIIEFAEGKPGGIMRWLQKRRAKAA